MTELGSHRENVLFAHHQADPSWGEGLDHAHTGVA